MSNGYVICPISQTEAVLIRHVYLALFFSFFIIIVFSSSLLLVSGLKSLHVPRWCLDHDNLRSFEFCFLFLFSMGKGGSPLG
jgi:hypothetical protein